MNYVAQKHDIPNVQFTMKGISKRITILSILGLLGAAAALIAILLAGDTFGYPGSAAYNIYENFNRMMALFIVLQSCAILSFRLRYRGDIDRLGRAAVVLAFAAWIGMALGTAAEFWLFSDLPYGQGNERDAAFLFYSISSLIGDLSLLVVGFELFRSRAIPRFLAAILILYLPLDIALWIAGQSIFLAPALVSAALAMMALHRTPTGQVEDDRKRTDYES